MIDVGEASRLKTKLARGQLGTALSLFMRDHDPLSVHALACGGRECISGVAEMNNIDTLTSLYIKSYPDRKAGEFVHDVNRYWNAMKHVWRKPPAKELRDDTEVMAEFRDTVNDAYLWDGWLTYQRVTKALPLEAQIFQVWWLALHPDVFAELTPTASAFFPRLLKDGRGEQKRRLRRAAERFKGNAELLRDPRTEPLPLMLDWP